MNGLLMLLLSSWISCAVSKVEILHIGSEYRAVHGRSLELTCSVTGGDTFEEWKNPSGHEVHNSSAYEYSTSGNEHHLKILKVTMLDAGKWFCVSKEGNNATFLMKINAQKLGTVKVKQSLVEGLPGIIKLNIIGYPEPSYKWKKDGTEIQLGDRFSVAKNGSLLISNVSSSDKGLYKLEAKQPPVTLDDVPDIDVSVLVRPTFSSVSVNENQTLGESITFKCSATGIPNPNITWKKDSNALTGDNRRVIDNNGLTINKIQIDDVGSYTCVASNTAGTKEQTSYLSSILVTIRSSPVKKQNLVKGLPGIVEVDMAGFPKPEFKWKKDGVDVVKDDRFRVAMNGSLLISNVEVSDQGTYEVLGRQSSSEKEIKDIVVTVLVPPTFTSVGVQEARTVGANITFKCNASGNPLPAITWKKGSEVLTADTRRQITHVGLTIINIEESDVGDYSCVANNSVGTKTQTSRLTSVLVPPQISDLTDENIEKGKHLKVNCSTTSGKPPADVEWKKNGIVVPGDQQRKDRGSSLLSIENIQPDQSGNYQCFAKNGAVDKTGKEVVRNGSMEVNVIYPPVFDPTSTNYVSVIGKPAEIKCVVNGNPAPNVSLSFNNKNIKGKSTKTSTQTNLSVSVNITGVDDFGEYTCIAKNILNEAKHVVRVTVPLKKPTITNVTSTCKSVTLSWKQDVNDSIRFEKMIVTVTHRGEEVHRELTPASLPSKTIEPLQEETKYNLTLQQRTNIKGIGFTVAREFVTEKCAPQKIKVVIEDGKTTLYWTGLDNVDKYILNYRVKGSKDWISKDSYTGRIQIPDLEKGQKYEFKVLVQKGGAKPRALTEVKEWEIKEDKKGTKADKNTTQRPPAVLSRKKGLSGGAIAAIVIVIILLVLIAVDIFCCFFNQCGVVHMCAAACSGRSRSKYNVDGTPEEGTKLKEIDIENGKEEPVA